MPDISICLITYNHEAFIEQALQSILIQKTIYSFQIVIGEDFSKDNTRAICESYAERFPDKIKLLSSVKNLGAAGNFIRTFDACDGKYFAFCEGDDYWLDENRLQEQVAFLEANPDYVICAGGSGYLDYQGNITFRDERADKHKVDFTVQDYLLKMCFETASIVFLKNNAFTLHESHADVFSGDQFIVLLLTMNGKKIRYIEKNLSIYRYHAGGITKQNNQGDSLKKLFLMLESFDSISGYRHHHHVELKKRIVLIASNHSLLNYPKRLWFILFNIGFAWRYRKYIPFTWKTFFRYISPIR